MTWLLLIILIYLILDREFDIIKYSSLIFNFYTAIATYIIVNTIFKWKFNKSIRAYLFRSSFSELAYASTIIPAIFTLSYILIIQSLFVKSKTFEDKNLVSIKGIVFNRPTYVSHPKGAAYYKVALKEYPNVLFQPRVVEETYIGLPELNTLSIGDSLTLSILYADFGKLKREEFSEKKHIPVFKIVSGNNTYYDLQTDTKLITEYNNNRFFYIFLAFIFMVPVINHIKMVLNVQTE